MLTTHIDKANANDPITVEWLDWQFSVHASIEARFPFPACNIIAQEQIFARSASKHICYLCGHKTDYKQTSYISFPPVAQGAWICKECDEC